MRCTQSNPRPCSVYEPDIDKCRICSFRVREEGRSGVVIPQVVWQACFVVGWAVLCPLERMFEFPLSVWPCGLQI